MIPPLKTIVRRLDALAGRVSGRRRVLVELRTPVYRAVLAPVYEALARDHGMDIWFTSEYPDTIRPLVPDRRFVSHREAEWRRFDLYMNADPWAAARLRRCTRRVNFFHGVAGKYDLDSPAGLPMGFESYDRVAFINADRMTRYLAAGVVTPEQARLVGYPKLDALASGEVDASEARASIGLAAGSPTILYAPTYSTASSLHLAGEQIIRALADAGFNVIVKLHDRSLDRDARYTGGIDWRARMRALERPGRVAYVEQADASPCLAAADLMVTDHSSVGFEYLVLDRPLVVFDAPDLPGAARINPEKIALLRSAAVVVTDPESLVRAARNELASPHRLSAERREVASRMFHEPGTAALRAVAMIRELIEQSRSARPVPHAGEVRGAMQ